MLGQIEIIGHCETILTHLTKLTIKISKENTDIYNRLPVKGKRKFICYPKQINILRKTFSSKERENQIQVLHQLILKFISSTKY